MSDTPNVRLPEAPLRVELIREELEELQTAVDNLDIIEIADAIGDIQYVAHGAALVFGLEKLVLEATTSNGILIGNPLADEEVLSDLRYGILYNSPRAVAKALKNILKGVDQMADLYDIDLDAVVDAIHKSNMSKLGEDGKPIYRPTDQKVMKGENYVPPTKDIWAIVFGEDVAYTGE
jgi:hypothetical protein